MLYDETLNYSLARPLGSNEEFERVVDSDCPHNLDGSPAGDDDCFKLEFSGWTFHVEFALKETEKV